MKPMLPKAETEGRISTPPSKPSADPVTPNPSTCAPESDSAYFDSDASAKEQESEEDELQQDYNQDEAQHESEPEHEEVPCHTIPALLKMRHGVDWQNGIEQRLGAECISEQQSGTVSEVQNKPKVVQRRDRPGRTRGEGTKRRSEGQKPSQCQQKKEVPSPGRGSVSEGLQVSDCSWLSRQVLHRRGKTDASLSDEEVVRAMKSNLNKLTIEKFVPICEKIMSCGIETSIHLETLIYEVFQKATTQHHFCDMYADLCELLHAHFLEHPVVDDPKASFKKILLNACQSFFEKHLKPPADLEKLDEEDRIALERKYKIQMLGNIKFVGALLVRQMLATKVLFAICEELLTEPTAESLEALAALLTVVGPRFDIPEWSAHAVLVDVFKQVQALTNDSKISCRVRCLLKDVLELRGARWQDQKPKKVEGPSTLKNVADTRAKEEAASGTRVISGAKRGHQGRTWSGSGGDIHNATGKRITSLASHFDRDSSSPKSTPSPEGYQRINSLAALKCGCKTLQGAEKSCETADSAQFDKDACHREVLAVLAELSSSHEVEEAILCISALSVPAFQQPHELCNMLERIAEEGSAEARKVCFKLVSSLFTERYWKASTLGSCLQDFIDEVCPDLKCDIPALYKILREELYPVLVPLVSRGMLQQSQLDALAPKD